MRKNNILNKKGLSLLEVIAVVIISGILLAFGAISIGNIIGSAEESQVENDAVLIINSCEVRLTSGNDDDDVCKLSEVAESLDSSFDKYDQDKTIVELVGDKYVITLVDATGGNTIATGSKDNITVN